MPFILPLDEMTVEEKMQAMEAIWESLSRNPDEIESPAWHEEVLRERQREVASGAADFILLDEVMENLKQCAAEKEPGDV